MYSAVPSAVASMALTRPSKDRSRGDTTPVSLSKATKFCLAYVVVLAQSCTWLNSPPAYTVEPTWAKARTSCDGAFKTMCGVVSTGLADTTAGCVTDAGAGSAIPTISVIEHSAPAADFPKIPTFPPD